MAYWIEDNGTLKQISDRSDWRPDPNGPTYPKQLLADPVFRADHGVMTDRTEGSRGDARYYNNIESIAVVNGEVVKTTTATPRSIDSIKEVKLQEARDLYWSICNEGVAVNIGGEMVPIRTRHDSHQEIKSMLEYLTANGGTQDAVTRSGHVITWDTTIAQTVIDAVEAKIASALSAEATHAAAINAYTEGQEQALIDYEVV